MIDAYLGDRIVDRASVCVDAPISVTDTTPRIVASSDAQRIGNELPDASAVIDGRHSYSICEGRHQGIYLPLMHDATVVGMIVLHGDPEVLAPYSQAVRTISELVTYHVLVVERLPQLPQLHDRFMADLLLSDTHQGQMMSTQAALFGIELQHSRIVSALDVEEALTVLYHTDSHSDALPSIGAARRFERARARLLGLLRQCAGAGSTDIFGFVDRRWLVVLSVVDSEQVDQYQQAALRATRRYLHEISSLTGASVAGGVGRYHGDWTQLCHSFADARVAAEKGEKLNGRGQVYTLEDLGLISFVADINGVSKAEMAQRLLRPIATEPQLLTTLETYLVHDMSPTSAAQALDVHRHTLGYRLDKIRALTGLDPRHFEAATQLYAALLLLKISEHTGRLLDICP